MKLLMVIQGAVFIAVMLLSGSADAQGWGMMQGGEHPPYGGYCRGPRGGGYGERMPVPTEKDARRQLETYFAGQDVVVGQITSHARFYLADIKDRKDALVDRVMIDKRSGRIRSVY